MDEQFFFDEFEDDTESNAFVRFCFTGLLVLHFSIAFWTRAWVMKVRNSIVDSQIKFS